MDSVYAATKEKDRDREKDKDKEKDKEREREMEMEAALYTNCLLLGLDASVLGQGGMPRSGLFRHSNPRMGETLLHFLLSALRGPAQSAKDFAGVWPIFDAGQSRDFRKIVQNLINELEAQGALPRSNSRVSSLATCCGQRFVELLWQLSAHALREVHKRSFPADVLANPLPASLTEIVAQSNHASALLTVTKARIALERRRFLDGATAAVRRQALWSSLAHDMTAEYRALCAEEAYLHQELDKLQEPKNQREGFVRELQNGSENSIEDRRLLSVNRATSLWESLLNHTAQHEKLASGPIEDLIAHREHRYRVSGPALRAAMERSSGASSTELSGFASDETSNGLKGEQSASVSDNNGLSYTNGVTDDGNEETRPRSEERTSKGQSPLDVAEILRRWTHSLQRIHKQAIRLARTNDGTGPDLIKETSDDGDNGHAQALRATLAEHKQHLANIQALISQLKESMPGMEASIATLREQVARTMPLMGPASTSSPVPDRLLPLREVPASQATENVGKTGTSQTDLVPPSPALKLPQIFSPGTMGRSSQSQRIRPPVQRMKSLDSSSVGVGSLVEQVTITNIMKTNIEGEGEDSFASLRQAVHDAALATSHLSVEEIKPERSEQAIEHFFTPVVSASALPKGDMDSTVSISSPNKQYARFSQEYHRYDGKPVLDSSQDQVEEQQNVKVEDSAQKQNRNSKPASKCLNYNGNPKKSNGSLAPETPQAEAGGESIGNELARPFSPPLLTELSSFTDSYDDLLGSEDFELSDVALEGVWFNPTV